MTPLRAYLSTPTTVRWFVLENKFSDELEVITAPVKCESISRSEVGLLQKGATMYSKQTFRRATDRARSRAKRPRFSVATRSRGILFSKIAFAEKIRDRDRVAHFSRPNFRIFAKRLY